MEFLRPKYIKMVFEIFKKIIIKVIQYKIIIFKFSKHIYSGIKNKILQNKFRNNNFYFKIFII